MINTCSLVSRYKSETFPWFPAFITGVLLFIAENHMPTDVIEIDSSRYVTQMQGSGLREACYVFIGLVGVAYLLRLEKYRLQRISPVAIAWGSLLIWCAVSISWADEPVIAFKRLIAYLLMITGAAGVSAGWSHRQMLQYISIVGAAQLTAGVVAEIATGYFTPWLPDYRFAGTQPWNLQGFCCLFLVLASLAAADEDPQNRKLFRCLAIYGFFFLVLTRSRGALLGAIVGAVIYLSLSSSVVTKVFLALGTMITLLAIYVGDLANTILSFIERGGEGTADLTGRRPLWELTQTFIRERPLRGYGYCDFWNAKRLDYFSSELHWDVSSTHSMYLDNVLTLGYVGLVLHTLLILLGIGYSGYYFAKSRAPIFALTTSICVVYLVVGTLETVVLIAPGPFAFGVTMLLWTLIIRRRIPLT